MKTLTSYIFVLCGLTGLVLSEPERECLREKVITFPELTTKNYVQLYPNKSMDLSAASVCLRFYTDQESSSPCLFSLAEQGHLKDFTMLLSAKKQFQLYIHNALAEFNGLSYHLNHWNSVCATWDSKTGLAQMFVNDVSSIRKTVGPKQPLKGEPSIILGQCHTEFDGGFTRDNIFTGFISDVHMHDEVLTPHQIKHYMAGKRGTYKLGDYINWHALKRTIFGSAQVEQKQQVTFNFKE
ncbi:serum amyloid P-component-like isoform X2 [Myxocyprinus asiaticus]|uniref:serum amyloid P-component-like isoform X2 n=1 Tax=Myxocyprinus asiaticus TaxID=70543 RepID=UPI0022231879|nr:serum amyloid P-component-like isoform X2 [Myxocyprinus asiaticus]